uniref:Zeta toxin domain-containing protein n=1 Tax=Triticum urartu TaxID=4572 RepID=A0A8R7P6F0_TRIUA
MVLEATRSQRFERVTRNLKVTRLFSTLVEELKAIGLSPQGPAQCSDVMVPVAHCDRSPVLLLMGGGMGAGKSTVLKDILKESFWSGAAANAVVVEADAFKETDVIYRAISSSLLVTALNEGRDVIMDGTLSWEPFFQQTVAMARAVHRQRYRMGVGYKVTEDGSITEDYWEPVEARSADEESEMRPRKPYRIELVGVVCDAYLAVVRGIRRAVITGRAVRVKSQLQSHKRFATAFRGYCGVVDNARLYSTNSMGAPKLIGWKDGESNLLVDPEEIGCLERVSGLNDEANCVDELYPDGQPSPSAWQDLVASPSRASVQRELRATVQASEARFRAASLADGALRGGDAPVQTF